VLTSDPAHTRASLDDNNGSQTDNDGSQSDNDGSLASDDGPRDEDNNSLDDLDEVEPPAAVDVSPRSPVALTKTTTLGPQNDDEIDQLDESSTDAAPPPTSDQPGTSQMSGSARKATSAKPAKKLAGKYVVLIYQVYSILT
jgi:hypothetical protein